MLSLFYNLFLIQSCKKINLKVLKYLLYYIIRGYIDTIQFEFNRISDNLFHYAKLWCSVSSITEFQPRFDRKYVRCITCFRL